VTESCLQRSTSSAGPLQLLICSRPCRGGDPFFFAFFRQRARLGTFSRNLRQGCPVYLGLHLILREQAKNVCTRKVISDCFYCGLESYCKKQLPAAAAIADDVGYAYSSFIL
jgi:hypothetical protein